MNEQLNAVKAKLQASQFTQSTQVVMIHSITVLASMAMIVIYMTQSKCLNGNDRFETRVCEMTPDGRMPWDMIAH